MRTILSVFFAIGFLHAISAQAVFEEEYPMSLGKQNALYIDVEGANKNTAEKAMEEVIKTFGKYKRNRKAKEFYAENANVPGISSESDIYVKFVEDNAQTRAYLWIYDGTDFIDSSVNSDAIDRAESIMQDFYVNAKKRVVQYEMDGEEDILKDKEKELKNLVKNNEKLHKNIEKWEKEIEDRKKKIEQAKLDIDQNVIDQETKQVEIEDQKSVVDGVQQKLNSIKRR